MRLYTILNMINKKEKSANPLLSAADGKKFEDLLLSRLSDDSTYISMTKDDFISKISNNDLKYMKNKILDFGEDDKFKYFDFLFKMTEYRNIVVREPFGSQSYPDFLLIKKGNILPIECKYSKKKTPKPVWNSSLPRAGGLYIFGAYGHSDVTFFKGEQYITREKRLALKAIFDFAEEKQKEMASDKDGTFSTYLRRMYNQDFNSLDNPKREIFEIETLAEISDW